MAGPYRQKPRHPAGLLQIGFLIRCASYSSACSSRDDDGDGGRRPCDAWEGLYHKVPSSKFDVRNRSQNDRSTMAGGRGRGLAPSPSEDPP